MESIEQSISNSLYSSWLMVHSNEVQLENCIGSDYDDFISATGISSSNSEEEYVPLTCGDFEQENAQYGKGTSIGSEVQFWPTKHSLVDNLNDNLGNYGQRSLDTNFQVELYNTNSRTLDYGSKTAENPVDCLTHSPGIISQYIHPDLVAERNGGSRSYDYIPVNTKDQVDGIPDIRVYVSKEWKNKTCEADSNKTSVDALQGSEDIVPLKTVLPIQTERDNFCLNLSSAAHLTQHLPETEFLTEDFHGIDVSPFISEEIENITPSINVEQNPLSVEVSYASPPFPSSSHSHNGNKRHRLQEETSERESVNDALLFKKEKVKKKLHEIQAPFEDTSTEKKRRDAIRAKRNRERRKHDIKSLENELNLLKELRNSLMNEVSQLQEKEDALTKSLKKYNLRNDKTHKGEDKK